MKKEISFEKNYLTVADIKSYLCISSTAAYELTTARTSRSAGWGTPSASPLSHFWPGWTSTPAYRPTCVPRIRR